MKTTLHFTAYHLFGLIFAILSLTACSTSSSPGPLEGTWQLSGQVDMIMTFRPDETEAKGVIEKVRYQIDKDTVLVTYLDGMAKGMTMRYTLTSPDSAITNLGTLTRLDKPKNSN